MFDKSKLHHIGWAVSSVEKASLVFRDMGYRITEPVLEPVQKVRVSYCYREGFPTVELLEPTEDSSPVARIIKKMGGSTPYHCCYAVDNIDNAVSEARIHGFLPLGKPIPGHGLDDALMVFLYHKDIGLVQIVEIEQ
jgi:methylmalonyl-CoA/ethylmalonyl-CoA epimerase